jgi:hypothetical protein
MLKINIVGLGAEATKEPYQVDLTVAPSPESEPSVLETLVKWLGGVSGALALLGALAAGSGIIISRSHAHALGLASILHHSSNDYVYDGGVFLLTLLISLPQVIFQSPYVFLTALAAVGAAVALRIRFAFLKNALWVPLFSLIGALALSGCSLVNVQLSLQTSNTLFDLSQLHPFGESQTGPVFQLLSCLLASTLLIGFSALCGLPGIKKDSDVSLNWGQAFGYRSLWLLTLLVLLLQAICLPLSYGQYLYSNEYHQISALEIKAGDGKSHSMTFDGQAYLLDNDDYLTIFVYGRSGLRRAVILIRKDEVTKVVISAKNSPGNS